jgi:SAM-dependent methyltransferase
MHKNSLLLFQKHVLPLLKPGMRVLEIGPNGFPSDYRKMVSFEITWDTLDIYAHPELTYPNAAEYSFPIPDKQYDLVVNGQVIEHVRKIWLWIREVERVCAPNGFVAIISPVSWPYHEAPIDCWRIYPDGMKALLEDTSLKVVHCEVESLECPEYRRHLPGRSLEHIPPKLRFYYRMMGKVGVPVERSYDLVTIAQRVM